MKFACEQCATKYSIADERVRGRVLKIRCKSCNHVITVREPDPVPAPRSYADSGPLETAVQQSIERSFGAHAALEENGSEHTVVSGGPLPGIGGELAGADDSEWYVSFDGEQEGPFSLAKAHERIRAERPRGKEMHCWKPGFFVWLPIEEVPEMAAALGAPRAPALPPLPSLPPLPKAPPLPKPDASARESRTTGSSPAVSPRKGGSTGSRKALGTRREEAAKKSELAVRKDPTGPRAALKVPKENVPAPMLPIDSKPMPLPPPPEPFPSAPMGKSEPFPSPMASPDPFPSAPLGLGTTRPESHLFRRAAAGGSPTPALGAKARDEAPAKKPLFQSASASASMPALAAPAPEGSAGASTKPNGKEEVSPFAAALAASTGGEVKRIDTGPVPLPPPPGDELPIDEASGLLNLSHVASQVAARATARPIETFGGQTVTPPSGPNGLPSTGPSPVVVMTGAAPRYALWLKLAAVGGGATTLLLLGVVIYLLARKPAVPAAPPVQATAEPARHVEDQPIAIADPPPPVTEHAGAPSEPKHNATPRRATPSRAAHGASGPALSSAQKGLAALYADGPEGTVPHALPRPDRPSHSGSQVSQNAILAVVSQNHRSLGLCYERVLKHDNTLKHARVVTRVKIGLSGRVTAVNVEDAFKSTEIGQCLVQTIRQWRFPPSDAEYETELPLILQAN